MDRGAVKVICAVLGIIGAVLLAVTFGVDNVSSTVGVLGSVFVGLGFLAALL